MLGGAGSQVSEQSGRLGSGDVGGSGIAHRRQRNLIGVDSLSEPAQLDEVRRWCASGLLSLTGHDDELVAPPLGMVARLDALARSIEAAAARRGASIELSWEELLLGRAALRSFGRRGRRSPNNSCQLLATGDGQWVALNLARDDDRELLDALIEAPHDEEAALDRWAGAHSAHHVVERGRLLGLALTALNAPSIVDPVLRVPLAARRPRAADAELVVVDLSSMWAGPLCASLLGQTGAEIIKVESTTRPDGARADATFYAWLHGDERQVSISFDTDEGVAELRALLESADVVIESSRPRALAQLGLDPFGLELKEGMVWLSITGHGRSDAPEAVAFGDDAAVAGGLVGFDRGGDPVFCGDAIADPITGMLGAAVVLSSLEQGGGELLDLSMARAASSMIDPFLWGTRPHFVTTDTTESEAIIIGGAILDVRRPAKPVVAV